MKKLAVTLSVVSNLAAPAISFAADTSSAAYNNGRVIGYVIGVIVIFLAVKKLLDK